MPEFSFKKGERLSSKKSISSLFQSGRAVTSYPVRIIYIPENVGRFPASVAISVPKRLFKRAVDRNFLKRRIREAYRLNKPVFYSLLEENKFRLKLVIQYTHREIVDFQTTKSGIEKGLKRMVQQIKEDPKRPFSE